MNGSLRPARESSPKGLGRIPHRPPRFFLSVTPSPPSSIEDHAMRVERGAGRDEVAVEGAGKRNTSAKDIEPESSAKDRIPSNLMGGPRTSVRDGISVSARAGQSSAVGACGALARIRDALRPAPPQCKSLILSKAWSRFGVATDYLVITVE